MQRVLYSCAMDLAWYQYIFVIIAGFAAGFINTLAGSGSLITLGLLTSMGIPATIANGSNRVGVLVQGVASAGSFHKQGVLDVRGGLMLAIPTIFGSLMGAQIATTLDEVLMRRAIGVVMVLMLFVILLRPKRWLEGTLEKFTGRPSVVQIIIFFIIGVYGGFIQAGVGIFLLAGLVLATGYNLVYANAIKPLIVVVFTISALAIFIANDQVDWIIGLMLAIGNAVGGWMAARMAVERGATFVRYVLIAVVVVSSLNLLGIFSLIGSAFS